MVVEALDLVHSISVLEAEQLTRLANEVANGGAVFVEVGSWKGHSASLIAGVTKEKEGHLYCVDHWKGSEFTSLAQIAEVSDVYKVFENNLKSMGLWEYITPMKMDSLTASKEFADKSIDFLFLDADHRYKQFKEDLEAWYPKVRGIICGHDCENYYSTASLELKAHIDLRLDGDYTGMCHAGIIKGLFDFFNDDYSIAEGTRIWFKKVRN